MNTALLLKSMSGKLEVSVTNSSSNIKSRARVYSNVALESATKGSDELSSAVGLRNDLFVFINRLSFNVDAKAALENDSLSDSEKERILGVLCEGLSDVLKDVLACLVRQKDIDALRYILRFVESDIQEKYGVCIVDVTTAVDLDDELRDLIKRKIKAETGMDSILHENVDKSIIGGIIMSVNGKCIDASMKAQLNHARSVLKAS